MMMNGGRIMQLNQYLQKTLWHKSDKKFSQKWHNGMLFWYTIPYSVKTVAMTTLMLENKDFKIELIWFKQSSL